MTNTTQNLKPKSQVKLRVQKIIALSSFIIFAGKLVAYFLTNSVGILTDALESTVNVTTGFITLYSIYVATKPQDENHPFGHGKAEFLSASVEGFLIIIAGIVIIYEAVRRLFMPAEILQLDIGIIIVAIAGLFNYLLGWFSIRTGKKNKSIALISGGKHLQSDTYSSIGLVAGLLILYFTGEVWLDSLIALIFGTIIIVTGIRILKETTSHLMDEADFKLIEQFRNLFQENKCAKWIDIHNFKLVKYGNAHHINCDLVLPYFLNLAEAHNEGEKLKALVVENFSEEIIFHLHIDECFKLYCRNCKQKDCPGRQNEFVEESDFDLKKFISEKPEQKA